MKRWKIVLPTLLATSGLPLVSLVGCGETIELTLNKWDNPLGTENFCRIYSRRLHVKDNQTIKFNSIADVYKWSAVPEMMRIGFGPEDGQYFASGIFLNSIQLYAGTTKLVENTDYIVQRDEDNCIININTQGISKIFHDGQIDCISGQFKTRGSSEDEVVLVVIGGPLANNKDNVRK